MDIRKLETAAVKHPMEQWPISDQLMLDLSENSHTITCDIQIPYTGSVQLTVEDVKGVGLRVSLYSPF